MRRWRRASQRMVEVIGQDNIVCTAIRLSYLWPPHRRARHGGRDVLCKEVQDGGDVAAAAVATAGGGEQYRLSKPADKHGGASGVPVTGGCGGAGRHVGGAQGTAGSGRQAGDTAGGQARVARTAAAPTSSAGQAGAGQGAAAGRRATAAPCQGGGGMPPPPPPPPAIAIIRGGRWWAGAARSCAVERAAEGKRKDSSKSRCNERRGMCTH